MMKDDAYIIERRFTKKGDVMTINVGSTKNMIDDLMPTDIELDNSLHENIADMLLDGAVIKERESYLIYIRSNQYDLNRADSLKLNSIDLHNEILVTSENIEAKTFKVTELRAVLKLNLSDYSNIDDNSKLSLALIKDKVRERLVKQFPIPDELGGSVNSIKIKVKSDESLSLKVKISDVNEFNLDSVTFDDVYRNNKRGMESILDRLGVNDIDDVVEYIKGKSIIK